MTKFLLVACALVGAALLQLPRSDRRTVPMARLQDADNRRFAARCGRSS
ncbi:hypothetical protein ACIBAC_00195 [Streptomyces sp. NPDC051362]